MERFNRIFSGALRLCLLGLLILLSVCFCACGTSPGQENEQGNQETKHDHLPVKIEGTPATCMEDGTKDVWYCAGCDTYFADPAGKEPLSEDVKEWKDIPALGHALTTSSTCDRCGKRFISYGAENEYFSLPDLGSKVETHTEKQLTFLKREVSRISVLYDDYNVGDANPLPVTLSFTSTKGADSYVVRISERPDMAEALINETKQTTVDVYNLKIDTSYFWQVECDGQCSDVALFTTTAKKLRNLLIDGVKNARDLGGWDMNNGATLPQGNLYRTAKWDQITEDGIQTVQSLGIRTEVDLRSPGDNATGEPMTESIVPGVQYINIGGANFAAMFEILSDKANYPVAMHCAVGADRTGNIALAVLGVCGVSPNDIYHDYLFSNMSGMEGGVGVRAPSGLSLMQEVEACPGETFQQKTYHYLTQVAGVNPDYVRASVRNLGGNVEGLEE